MAALMIIKTIFGFIGKNWKIFLALIIAGLIVYGIVSYGNSRYTQGANDALAKVKTQVAAKNTENRATETKVKNDVNDFSKKRDQVNSDRIKKEQKIVDHINSEISKPSETCDIPPTVVDDINAIRALGPKGDNQ